MGKYTGLLIMLLVIALSCKNDAEDKNLSQTIVKAVRLTQASHIKFDTVVRSNWDHLFILHPYITADHIDNLSKEIEGLDKIDLDDIQRSDGKSYLIFTQTGSVVNHTSVPRNPCCNFIVEGSGSTKFSRAQALFKIQKTTQGRDTIYTLSAAN